MLVISYVKFIYILIRTGKKNNQVINEKSIIDNQEISKSQQNYCEMIKTYIQSDLMKYNYNKSDLQSALMNTGTLYSSSIRNSSSEKIKDLYQQFQNLKSRISSSTSKKVIFNEDQHNFRGVPKPHINHIKDNIGRDIFSSIQTSKNYLDLNKKIDQSIRVQQSSRYSRQKSNKLQMFRQAEHLFESFADNYLSGIESKVATKMHLLNEKLLKTISFLQKAILQKKNMQKCCQDLKSSNIIKVVQSYENKIKKLNEDHQRKVIMLVKENSEKDKQTITSSLRLSKPNLNFEEEILIKETEISQLKIECCRLRKYQDTLKVKNETQQLLLKQIQEQLQQNRGKIKDNKNSLQVCSKTQEDFYLKKQLQKKNQEIFQLKELLQKELKKTKDHNLCKCNNEQQTRKGSMTQDRREGPTQDIFGTKSAIFSSSKNRQNLKKVSTELQLVVQEKQFLQLKNNKYQDQIRTSQADEERFLQQNSILKTQIKYLNLSIKRVDEIFCKYLKKEKIDKSSVAQLSQTLKVRKMLLQN